MLLTHGRCTPLLGWSVPVALAGRMASPFSPRAWAILFPRAAFEACPFYAYAWFPYSLGSGSIWCCFTEVVLSGLKQFRKKPDRRKAGSEVPLSFHLALAHLSGAVFLHQRELLCMSEAFRGLFALRSEVRSTGVRGM